MNKDPTTREVEVAKLLTDGKSNKEIAGELNISLSTVKSHLGNLYSKHGVHGKAQLIVKILKDSRSLVTAEPSPSGGEGDMWQLVIKDMEERHAFGVAKYGTPLRAFDGRKSLKDAYQEQLDQLVYLRKELYERNGE